MSETYGQMIARLRHERGWTQRQLANESGVRLRTLQDVEADKHTRPQRATRAALDAVFGVEDAGHTARPEDVEWVLSLSEDTVLVLRIVAAYLETLGLPQKLEWLEGVTTPAFAERAASQISEGEAAEARRAAAAEMKRRHDPSPQRVKDEAG